MLDEMVIDNLGLIDSVTLSFEPGLVVVTGETGTGKTMLVGGLRLLLGQKARKDAVGPHGESAVVEGRFFRDDNELVGRRVVTAQRSRAYLNGDMVTADQLQNELSPLVEIVAQHDQLLLRNASVVRALVDTHLDVAGIRARRDYERAFQRWRELDQAAEALGGDRRALERELELTTYQVEEIGDARLTPGLDTELLEQARRLRHREELVERFDRARSEVEIARDALGAALDDIRRAAELDHSAAETESLLGAVAAEIAEVDGNIRSLASDVPHDADGLATIEQRLAQIGDLKRKYGDTVEDVIGFAKTAAARVTELQDLLERASTLAADLDAATAELQSAGEALRTARVTAASRLTDEAVGHLRDTGMADPIVIVDVAPADPTAAGADRCRLLFASDQRLTPMPVRRVASGGELSRLILALSLASGAAAPPVLVFDEVDSGVGGETGLAVGRKLASLAERSQVLCVTHLPQVAAFADQHFVVERQGTTSTVRELSPDERAVELARMLSGMSSSGDAQRHAAELLAAVREARK